MTFKKLLVLLLVPTFFASASFAQKGTYTRPSALGVSFTLTDFTTAQRIRSSSLATVINNKQGAKLKEMSPGIGINYFKGLSDHVDLATTLNGTFAQITLPDNQSPVEQFLLEADASINLKMFPDKYVFTPYLSVGVGANSYNEQFGAFIPLGGGFKLNLFDEAAIFISSQYRVPVTTETSAYHFTHAIGIAGIIGKKKEPAPLKAVEIPQAPKDTDGDGINDDVDKCPEVAGVAQYEGCPVPDTDSDGINDSLDKCPTVAGIAKYNGCPIPDTDGDGINDELDKCPTVAGTAKYEGCPVPDTDGDGINDEDDKCPTLPGVAENNGCPEVKEEVIKKVNYAATRIYFATASAKLLPKSFSGLNDVVKILESDKDIKLSIEGHTDNVGKDDYNQTLSEQRANSVREYFLSKGIDESRLAAQGFGETQPIADNKTTAGKSKNRRVVMRANY